MFDKSKPIIITSGNKYIDIDGYSSIFAYKILLKTLGYDVYAYSSGELNQSVSKLILDLGYEFDDITNIEDANYIVLDVSNPNFIDYIVKQERIIELIDHHSGYENYYDSSKIKVQIEEIGSVCTVIYEKYIEYQQESLITPSLAKIMVAAILDNTLNLKSDNTTDRDLKVYKELLDKGSLDDSFTQKYFNSCYGNLENLEESIKKDIKKEKINDLLPQTIGQLIMLNKIDIINNKMRIKSVFEDEEKWMINIICLEDGRSYILTSDELIIDNLKKILKLNDFQGYLVSDKYKLRKEIIKLAIEYDKI